MAIAYCTNCKANFTDKDEVASINSGPPHHCAGCASVAAANPPAEPVDVDAAVNNTPFSRDVYGGGVTQGTVDDNEVDEEHVDGDPDTDEPDPEPEREEAAA